MEGFYAFSLSQQGKTHVDSGVVCQDYSDTFSNEKCAVIAVSDGHGSENFVRSDRGSKYACEAALEAAKDFLGSIVVFDPGASKSRDLLDADYDETVEYNELYRILGADDQDETVVQLCKNILVRWNEKVRNDYESNPFSEEEVKNVSEKYRSKYLLGEKQEHAYGATLQLAILTRHYFLAIRNGDGECVTIDKEGHFSLPIPENDFCEANYTTSLCDSAAIEDFRYALVFEDDPAFPLAVFLGSDGIDNSYTNDEELFSLYRNITRKAVRSGTEEMVTDVTRALEILTNRGSGDDVSIAGILDLPGLPQIAEILEADAELRRQAIEAQRESKRRAQREREKTVLIKRLDDLSKEYRNLKEDISEFSKRELQDFRTDKDKEYESLKQRHQALCEEIEDVSRKLAEIKGIDDDHLVELIGRLKTYFAATSPKRVAASQQEEQNFDGEGCSQTEEAAAGMGQDEQTEQSEAMQETAGESTEIDEVSTSSKEFGDE